MAKLTDWLVTVIGVILLLPETRITKPAIAIAVLVIGISKLMRNYKKRKK